LWKLECFIRQQQTTIELGELSSSESDKNDENDNPALFASFLRNQTCQPRRRPSAAEDELTTYLNEPLSKYKDDPLQYWKVKDDSSLLKKMARDMLAITATSAPSERVFSIAGKYYRPDRSQLGVDTFHSLLLIKCNKQVL